MLDIIQSGYNGIKGALDIAQGIAALKTETAINQAVIDIQRLLLDAQRALTEADRTHSGDLKHATELEQEIVRLKDWSAEKERYQLHAIDGRTFAYVQKPGMENGQPAHWLCANCFDNRHIKSILQFAGMMSEAAYRCASCDATIRVYPETTPGN